MKERIYSYNKREADILQALLIEPFINQRVLAENSGYSLGAVNKSLKNMQEKGFLNEAMQLTKKAKEMLDENIPRNAIILAAGYGMRMVPVNMQVPKALMEIKGEVLIERIIKQLHEVGVKDIYVVVGFMKDKFEYLIDDYGVNLIVNSSYASKNNLYSLNLASEYLANSYIIPCDIWCRYNPFRSNELYSWYMVDDRSDEESSVRINRKMELVSIPNNSEGNGMLGISYLMDDESKSVREKIRKMAQDVQYDEAFWEEALYEKEKMIVQGRVVSSKDFVEINTYEQLREIDEASNQLKSDAINVIAEVFETTPLGIKDITVLKKGMTNRSFSFICNGEKYIMRIPGEGTEQLINRREEADVYATINAKGICDDIAYINPENGYKITAFLENARVCDSDNEEDVQACMRKLREFHSLRLMIKHDFDLYKQIEFYESLWQGKASVFRDYEQTKQNVLSLKSYIDGQEKEWCLTHIDAVPDNFLFTSEGDIRLIDWEYAGMQDPHVDIAMFCIYSLYDRQKIDNVIDIYFEGKCTKEIRVKIYCYIALCGLLWSNWCEYKRSLGVEFGEYSLRQYRYAKEYYRIAKEELGGAI